MYLMAETMLFVRKKLNKTCRLKILTFNSCYEADQLKRRFYHMNFPCSCSYGADANALYSKLSGLQCHFTLWDPSSNGKRPQLDHLISICPLFIIWCYVFT